MTDRRDLLRLTGVLVALLAVTGAILLATGGGSGSSGDARPSESKQIDGIVVEAAPVRLRLRPASGGGEMTFQIRATERPNFDVYHLQQHAADGLLTRVTYVQEGATLYALRADDAPQPGTP